MTCPPLGAAEVFKRELPDGTIQYSDQPHPEAEEMHPGAPQVIESFKPTVRPPARAMEVPGQAPAPYDLLDIVEPTNDEVIWSNERLAEISVDVDPPVSTQQGHVLKILMDGERVAESSNGSRFLLQNIFRGTHVLQAVIEGPDGTVLKRSEPVTFHMKQHSILNPPSRP